MAQPSLTSSTQLRPTMIIFDLDYTLWPFYLDADVTAPVRAENGRVVDRNNFHLAPFPDVPAMLPRLRQQGFRLAVASRSPTPEVGHRVLEALGWRSLFDRVEIVPESKENHLRRISRECGVPLDQMLFFDDEMRSIKEASNLNVVGILVLEGLNDKMLEYGLEQYHRRRSAQATPPSRQPPKSSAHSTAAASASASVSASVSASSPPSASASRSGSGSARGSVGASAAGGSRKS